MREINCQKGLGRRGFLKSVLMGIVYSAVFPSVIKIGGDALGQDSPVFKRRLLNGLAYSPFRKGQNPGGVYPSADEIKEDINRIKSLAGMIRTFSLENSLSQIPGICEEIGVDCYPCAPLSADASENQSQIEKLVQIGNSGPGRVKGLIVGDGVISRECLDVDGLAGLIAQARSSTSALIGTAENWQAFNSDSFGNAANALDFGFVVAQPYRDALNDSGIKVENAARYAADKLKAIQVKYSGRQFILETGWPTFGKTNGLAVPGLANQAKFLKDIVTICDSERIAYVLYEYADESWRETEESKAEGHFGLLYKDRTFKNGLASALTQNFKITGSSARNLQVFTYPGCNYSLLVNSPLAQTGWHKILEFTGADGTNSTLVELPAISEKERYYKARWEL